jgi:hypothetical protein
MKMTCAILLALLPPFRVGAALSQADYQNALLAAAQESFKEAQGLLPEPELASIRALIDGYSQNARSFSMARVTKTYGPALATAMPPQEKALEAALRRMGGALKGAPLPKTERFFADVAPRREAGAWDEAGPAYEVRYGGGDNMNWLEVYIDNLFYRFKTSPAPSTFEPILRFSPAVYQWNSSAVGSLIQIGINGYFFSEPLRKINPLGLAVGLGNPTAPFPILGMFDAQGFRGGLIVHLKIIDVGFFQDPALGQLITTSLNFQILRGFF